MGCTPSKPAPNQLSNSNETTTGNAAGATSRSPTHEDPTGGNADTRNPQFTPANSQKSGGYNDSRNGGPQIQPQQGIRPGNNGNATMGHGIESNGRKVPAGVNDPRWIHLWKAHQSILLDPADVHSTVEELMARGTNKLSSTEVTFMLRKLRAIVRSSTSQENRKFSGRILGNNSNHAQIQETRSVADRFHLLSSHVVRRLLPKPPSSTTAGSSSSSTSIVPSDSVFLLLLYLHESNWDRLAEIAVSTAKVAGLEMDVNKHQPPTSAPDPVKPATSGITAQDLPSGVSFHALTFLIGLALRKWLWCLACCSCEGKQRVVKNVWHVIALMEFTLIYLHHPLFLSSSHVYAK